MSLLHRSRSNLQHVRQRFSLTSELMEDERPIFSPLSESGRLSPHSEELGSPTSPTMPSPDSIKAPAEVYMRTYSSDFKDEEDGGGDPSHYHYRQRGPSHDSKREFYETAVAPRPVRPVYTTLIPSSRYHQSPERGRPRKSRNHQARRRCSNRKIIAASIGAMAVMVAVMVVFVILGTQKVI